MQRRFYQVDVFSDTAYKGNPLGVVLDGQDLETQAMQDYSLWSNLSEVTYVLPATDQQADFRFRIFARQHEYRFAGHPALGTARAWLEAGGVPRNPRQLIVQCGAGLVPINIDGNLLSFASPPAIRSGELEPGELAELVGILDIDPAAVKGAQWVDNGPGWAGILLENSEQVLDIVPKIPQRPGRWKIGVFGALPQERWPEKFEVRALTIEDGALREDPVTGSLNGAGTQWLIDAGYASAPLVNRQGAKAGRDGQVHVCVAGNELWVGGATSILISGTIEL
ncbi:PhzF family phenazine biosynthesis protein [Glutamicibacter sp. TV12E]|uniref:PhzF family phenazine biosynthesis protein n=1 Tax=Glutamicibacter sp. TV12E TaxID=3446362 RepID=UPI0040332AC0